jgi:hypothetical protein
MSSGTGRDAGGDRAQAEVLAVADGTVKVDAREDMSYADYARQRGEPVVTVQRIIDRRAQPPAPVKTAKPNMTVRQEVMWSESPPEPPPRPQRLGATVHSEVMHRSPPPKPARQGIGSMQPPGRG